MRVCDLLDDLKDCEQDAQVIIAAPDIHSGHVLELESILKDEKESVVILLAHPVTKRPLPETFLQTKT
jgi:hypothetical protein